MVHTDVSERILAFQVDDGRSDLSFVRRLAIENGWSRGFAERAFEEYKRFLVICYEGGQMVTPSDVVDEVDGEEAVAAGDAAATRRRSPASAT